MMTAAQQRFADEYLANGYNAAAAYRVAYPNASDASAKAVAYRVLKYPDVKKYIDERRNLIYDSLAIDAAHIAEQLASIAFAEKGDEVYNVQAKIKALDLLQKQLGLQTKNQNISADVAGQVTIVEDLSNEDNTAE